METKARQRDRIGTCNHRNIIENLAPLLFFNIRFKSKETPIVKLQRMFNRHAKVSQIEAVQQIFFINSE